MWIFIIRSTTQFHPLIDKLSISTIYLHSIPENIVFPRLAVFFPRQRRTSVDVFWENVSRVFLSRVPQLRNVSRRAFPEKRATRTQPFAELRERENLPRRTTSLRFSSPLHHFLFSRNKATESVCCKIEAEKLSFVAICS